MLDVERVETPKAYRHHRRRRRRLRKTEKAGGAEWSSSDERLFSGRHFGKGAIWCVNDDQITCRTHLGALLRCGDRVLGYDVRAANLASSGRRSGGNEPDVVLVRKCRKQDPDGPTPKRHWKLDQMEADEVHDEAGSHRMTRDIS